MSLPACSLINSYDDVVGATQGNGGGSTTTTSTTGTGGTGQGSGGATTTTTTSTGSGGGGGEPVLNCTAGTPFEVQDLSGEVDPNRFYREHSAGYQPNGDTLNVFFQRGDSLRAMAISLTSESLQNTFDTPAWDVSPGRKIGNQYGMVVSRPPPGGQTIYPVDLVVFGNNFQNPAIFPISDGTLTPNAVNSPRAVFAYRGPGTADVDVVLRVEEANAVYRAIFHRHGGSGVPFTELVPTTPFGDEEAASARAVLRTGDGKVHAFVGNPDMNGSGGTKRWSFMDSSASATPPVDLGSGYILLDAYRKSATENVIAYGHITANSLELTGAVVADAKVSTLTPGDLDTVLTLGSFLDVPSGGSIGLQDDAVLMVGPSATKDKMILMIGKIGASTAYYQPNLFQPEAGAKFGDAAVLVTNSPISSLGGVGYIVYAERWGSGSAQYDKVKVVQIACSKQ